MPNACSSDNFFHSRVTRDSGDVCVDRKPQLLEKHLRHLVAAIRFHFISVYPKEIYYRDDASN